MPSTFGSRRLSRSAWLVPLVIVAVLSFGGRIALAVEPGLAVINPPGSLVYHSPGKETLRVRIDGRNTARGTSLVVRLLRYGPDAIVIDTPVTSYSRTIAPAKRAVVIPVEIDFPGLGLFLVEATLIAANGATIETTKINVATVSPVTPSSFPGAGVITHFGQLRGAPGTVLPLLKSAGFGWIRDELYWSKVEEKAGLFTFPRAYDDYIKQASQFGIKPLIVLDYGNSGAHPGLFKGPQGFAQTPEERSYFVRYVDALVRRYGNTVKHWELWNEPAFAQVSFDDYVALLKEVYVAVKIRSPDATVISCGGGGAGGGPGGDCITAIAAHGALEYQDAFSVHPYMSPFTPEKGYRTEGAPLASVNIPVVWPYLSRMLASHPRADKQRMKLWITEIGWPSSPASDGLSEPGQAANLARSFLLSRRYNAVEVMFWYDLVDDGANPSDKENNFGMLRADLSPKPAFVAAAVLARTLGSRGWDLAISDTPDVKVYQYGEAGDSVIAGWRTDESEETTLVRIPPGSYVQRDWQGVTSPVVVPAKGLDWKLGPLPRYLIPAGRDNDRLAQ
jgi:hypothetical protein